jgi:ankyrin repeat protein
MTLKVTTFQSYARRYWTWYTLQLSKDEVSSFATSLKDRAYDKMAYACSYVWINGEMWFMPWVSIPASPAHMLAWTGLYFSQVPDDSKTADGWTSLFFAAFAGQLNMVQALAQNRSNLEVSDIRKRTALSYAVSRTGNFEVVKILVENGSDVNSTSEDGRSILSYAVAGWGANPDTVRFLLQHGADVHSADTNGKTALSYATAQRILANVDVIRALIENGADLNSRDKDGRTPLSYAVGSKRNDKVEVVRLLAEHGADATIQDSTGQTALSYLMEGDREAGEITLLLRSVNTDKSEDVLS